ncbi:hypothetical protein [Sphingomonas sp. DT-51]|uniref:hypothetical protein n=1 Tax=Sphingomonas sp. DT-51 TaxID=3396165 RepID=UPI003F54196B
MVREAPSLTRTATGDYVVRAPQAGDVLAGSLNAAFRRDKALPSDMACLLSRLSRIAN